MNDEQIPKVRDADPVFAPPSGSQISVGSTTHCRITFPDDSITSVDLQQAPAQGEVPDPNLRINGKMATSIDIVNGVGKFNLLYNYPMNTAPQPDVTRFIAAKQGPTEIPGGTVTYRFAVRDAFANVTPGTPEFAVFGGDDASVLLHVVNGEDDSVGGATVKVSCADGNVRFKDAAGDDKTQQMIVNGSMVYYADFTTDNTVGTPGYGIAKVGFTAQNTGIFDIQVALPGYNQTRQFTLVVADDQIVGGGLPPPRFSFAGTLNLDGPATTFVRLASAPSGVPSSAKVVLVVNGIPVAPFDLTVQQFTTVGYELPKRWFTQKTIDGTDPNGKAMVYYMVQSLDDDPNDTRSYITKFQTIGTVMNRPDPTVGKRTLPIPTVSDAVVVNQSVIEPGHLPVEIDFTNSGVAAGLSGYMTVYANGYSSSTSTSIDNVQTIPQQFTTEAGKMIVKVDASLLWGFHSSGGQQSKILIDYYVMLAQPSHRREDPAANEIEDPQERDAGKAYSQYLANGWTVATPGPSD